MLWIVVITIVLGIAAVSFMKKTSLAMAERQIAAQDPEMYRMAKEYEESQRPENLTKAAGLLEEQRREAKSLLTADLKPISSAAIVIKPGETAYWNEACRCYEERSLTDLNMAGRGMREVDTGPLVLTDKRIVFVGKNKTIEIALAKVVALKQLDGSFEVSVANAKPRRLGTGNPRAEVILNRLIAAIAAAPTNGLVVNDAKEMENPVFVTLSQTFHGQHDLVIQTLDAISTVLQSEIDKRAPRYRAKFESKPVDASSFLTTVSGLFNHMAQTFAKAEEDFAVANSPKGGPEMLANAYGNLLDRLLEARETLLKIDGPPMFAATETAYREFIGSYYGQLSKWPSQAAEAAQKVHGDSYDLELTAVYDVAKLEGALARESATI